MFKRPEIPRGNWSATSLMMLPSASFIKMDITNYLSDVSVTIGKDQLTTKEESW